jgi:thiamine-phosphate diphosphorylase
MPVYLAAKRQMQSPPDYAGSIGARHRKRPTARSGLDRRIERLPRVLVVTDRHLPTIPLEEVVRLIAGPEIGIVFRDKDMRPDERARLAARVCQAARAGGSLFLVATSGPEDWGDRLAIELRADGVHLSGNAALPPRLPRLVGRSCHNRSELERAILEGLDFAFLGPVYRPLSKVGVEGIGMEKLRRLLEGVPERLAVFAIGGMSVQTAGDALRSGAYGVAVVGAVLGTDRPKEAVQELIRVTEEVSGSR